MPNIDWERSLQAKTKLLTQEYQLIVAEFFPNCGTVDDFVNLFCKIFANYQPVVPRKMDPDSIRERKISCSSAAALLGVWWMQQCPQLIPIFLIEDTRYTGNARKAAHVNVALPFEDGLSAMEAVYAFSASNSSKMSFNIVDWTEHSGMKQSNPAKRNYEVRPIAGVGSYIKNRVGTLGLPKKYSTARINNR
jgi:hypothetical protein